MKTSLQPGLQWTETSRLVCWMKEEKKEEKREKVQIKNAQFWGVLKENSVEKKIESIPFCHFINFFFECLDSVVVNFPLTFACLNKTNNKTSVCLLHARSEASLVHIMKPPQKLCFKSFSLFVLLWQEEQSNINKHWNTFLGSLMSSQPSNTSSCMNSVHDKRWWCGGTSAREADRFHLVADGSGLISHRLDHSLHLLLEVLKHGLQLGGQRFELLLHVGGSGPQLFLDLNGQRLQLGFPLLQESPVRVENDSLLHLEIRNAPDRPCLLAVFFTCSPLIYWQSRYKYM